MKPAIPLHDKAFRYTPAAQTDLKATFRRIKKELREADERKAAEFYAISNVRQINRG